MSVLAKWNNKILPMLVIIISAIAVGFVWIVGISSPQHNLISWQLLIGTLFVTALVMGCSFAWLRFIADKLGKANSFIFWIGLVLYGIGMLIVSLLCNNGVGLIDHYTVIESARELAFGEPLDNPFYFSIYANNFKPTMLLSWVMWVCKIVGINSGIVERLLIIGLILGSIVAVRYLISDSQEIRNKLQVPVLILFVFFWPTICYVSFSYTDSLSYGLGIIGIAITIWAYRVKCHKAVKVLLWCIAGALVAIGIVQKITVVIPVIAIGMIMIFKISKKFNFVGLLVVLASLGLTLGGIELAARQYDVYVDSYETKAPLINWIALGLCGDGTFAASKDAGYYIQIEGPTSVKKEMAKEHIKNNVSNIYSLSHYASKVQYTFATGNLGAIQTFNNVGDVAEDNIVGQCFHSYGAYYWRMSQVCFCYMYALWTIILIGAVFAFVALIKRRELNTTYVWSLLGVFGFILFMLIWESCPRQIFNQIPGIVLCVVMSLQVVFRINE